MQDAALAKQLLQECAAMEVEIAMLKNKRTDEEVRQNFHLQSQAHG